MGLALTKREKPLDSMDSDEGDEFDKFINWPKMDSKSVDDILRSESSGLPPIHNRARKASKAHKGPKDDRGGVEYLDIRGFPLRDLFVARPLGGSGLRINTHGELWSGSSEPATSRPVTSKPVTIKLNVNTDKDKSNTKTDAQSKEATIASLSNKDAASCSSSTESSLPSSISSSDVDGMPGLEDNSSLNLLALPGTFPSLPDFSKPLNTKTGTSSDSPVENEVESKPPATPRRSSLGPLAKLLLKNEAEDPWMFPPRRSSLGNEKKSKLSNEIDPAHFDDELMVKNKGDGDGDVKMTEEGGEKQVTQVEVVIEWDPSIRQPENNHEKELCERVCKEVALQHGYPKVLIRSSIITLDIQKTFTTKRRMYFEPHLIATFSTAPSHDSVTSIIKRRLPTYKPKNYDLRSNDITKRKEEEQGVVKTTAFIYVGPDFIWPDEAGYNKEEQRVFWESWGIWRKAAKEPVAWCRDGDLSGWA